MDRNTWYIIALQASIIAALSPLIATTVTQLVQHYLEKHKKEIKT